MESIPEFGKVEAMIYVSEVICKPTFGEEYFGQVRADSIQDTDKVIVDGSCGFIEELLPLANKYYNYDNEIDNILVVRVHRPGYDFKGDSRGYLKDEDLTQLGFNVVDIYNDGTEEEFLNKVKDVYWDFVGGDFAWQK